MQSGVVKPSEILEGYVARVHQGAPYLNAVVDQDYEVLVEALELERLPLADRQSLPLYGLYAPRSKSSSQPAVCRGLRAWPGVVR